MKSKKFQITGMVLSLFLPIAMVALKTHQNVYFYLDILIYIIIAFVIVSQITLLLSQNGAINLFLCALLFYITISIFRKMVLAIDPSLGAINYMLGGAFQILFGIGFAFININTKNFKLVQEE